MPLFDEDYEVLIHDPVVTTKPILHAAPQHTNNIYCGVNPVGSEWIYWPYESNNRWLTENHSRYELCKICFKQITKCNKCNEDRMLFKNEEYCPRCDQ